MPISIKTAQPPPVSGFSPRVRASFSASTAPARLYAALDLGTHNCRLLVAEPSHRAFRVVDSFSRIVRLGEGLAATGVLAEGAQERALAALQLCAEKLAKYDLHVMRHVATEACRRASNGPAFVERVYAQTGLALDVITAAEEARLAVSGCQALFQEHAPYALVFDIGGGSTELIFVQILAPGKTRILGWTSVPWGVVSLSEGCALPGVDGSIAYDYAKMKELVRVHLAPFDDAAGIMPLALAGQMQTLGTSGTVTTLTSLYLDLPFYSRARVDGAVVPATALQGICQRLEAMTFAERAAEPCVGEDRADLVIAGCAILEAILDFWPIPEVRIADRGIREGVLRALMRRDGYAI